MSPTHIFFCLTLIRLSFFFFFLIRGWKPLSYCVKYLSSLCCLDMSEAVKCKIILNNLNYLSYNSNGNSSNYIVKNLFSYICKIYSQNCIQDLAFKRSCVKNVFWIVFNGKNGCKFFILFLNAEWAKIASLPLLLTYL